MRRDTEMPRLLEKYGATWGPYLHALFGQLFSILPVGTLVNDAVLIIHGGVGRDPENQLTRLRDLDPTLREAPTPTFLKPIVLIY